MNSDAGSWAEEHRRSRSRLVTEEVWGQKKYHKYDSENFKCQIQHDFKIIKCSFQSKMFKKLQS